MATKLPGTAKVTRGGLHRTLVLFTAMLLSAFGARAHAADPQPVAHYYSPAELQQLVGPIALYVDDLIGIVLPASAYPDQVMEAARFLDAREQDPSLQPSPYWEDSVVALLNYPQVLRLMADNPRWLHQLGDAFVYQQADLLAAIQQFRQRTMYAGNLQSDSYQTVTQSDGAIEIAPANPEVIYVPYYSPVQVVSYYAGPAIRYYPYGYPVYDYPYPAGYSFRAGFFFGVSTAFIVSWHTHLVHVYPWDYDRHPFYRYRHRYHEPYYVRHERRDRDWDRHDYVWRYHRDRDDAHGDRGDRHDERYPDRQRYTAGAFTGGATPAGSRNTWQARYPDTRGAQGRDNGTYESRYHGDAGHRGDRQDHAWQQGQSGNDRSYRGNDNDSRGTPPTRDGDRRGQARNDQRHGQPPSSGQATPRPQPPAGSQANDAALRAARAAFTARAQAEREAQDRYRTSSRSSGMTPPAAPARPVTPPSPRPTPPSAAPVKRAPVVRYAPPQARAGVKASAPRARPAPPPKSESAPQRPAPQSDGSDKRHAWQDRR